MAGGAGTRLWPLSSDEKPKQFQNLSGEGTLLEQTITRLITLEPEICLIVTARKYEKASLDELEKTSLKGKILSEPAPRNTAAAILYSATYLSKLYDDAIMVVLPADHYITRRDEFIHVLKKAISYAEKEKLVTIGIEPVYPETGYGYIKAIPGTGDALTVDMFVEKPDLETAKRYILEGNYFWNSGIFVWKVSAILDNFKRLMSGHYAAFKPLRDMSITDIEASDGPAWKTKESVFASLDPVSIDYGIIEKAENRIVIPGKFGWGDLGSWNSIDDILKPDANMNRTPSPERVIYLGTKNSSVFTETRRIALVGVSNLVVVETGNDILVMDKDSAQRVREVVALVNKKDQPK